MSIFPAIFLKSILCVKTGEVEVNRYCKMVQYCGWLRLLNMLFPGRIYIARFLWHFGDFCNIFLPNISEDKKVLLSESGALALCHMATPALVISLRP